MLFYVLKFYGYKNNFSFDYQAIATKKRNFSESVNQECVFLHKLLAQCIQKITFRAILNWEF